MVTKIDSKILSSCHINFLFGAGVNGGAFPQLEKFEKTMEAMNNYLPSSSGWGFEDSFDKLNEEQKKAVRELFIEEFHEHLNQLDSNHDSIVNLETLLSTINEIVDRSENRNQPMKQINVFTANYDDIVERSLRKLGYLYNSVSASNIESHAQYFNMVGYDYLYRKYIPTFFVSKIHGDIDNPILPGLSKFDKALEANKFEVLFKMKEKLLKPYSLLFVIGYSGRDDHINKILNDCIQGGLTVYWFKYSENDTVPAVFKEKVEIIENKDHKDTTKLCAEMLKSDELWIVG